MKPVHLLTITLTVAISAVPLISAHAQQHPIVTKEGSVKLDISETTSMTDLQKMLEQQGYTDVRLSPVRPNTENPRPDVQGTGGPARDRINPNVTPIHKGWNGTAKKDGRTVNILIDDRGMMTTK